jgi:HSP20 family protein
LEDLLMTLVRYEPWALVDRLQRSFDRAFDGAFAASQNSDSQNVSWIPTVDVHEEAERFVVRADLPGVNREDIEITAEKGVLTLRGERKSEKREQTPSYARHERVAGSFLRRFTLPENADGDTITATHVNGVLEVVIPKKAQPEARRIKIEAA